MNLLTHYQQKISSLNTLLTTNSYGLSLLLTYSYTSVRYGIIDWAPTYLKEVKHFSVDKQSWAYFLYEYAGIFGMLASGYLSDKVFKGHRAPPMLLFLTGVLVAVFIY